PDLALRQSRRRDQAIAAAVARRLGVDHHHITDGTDSGEAYIHGITTAVESLDAMLSWAYVPAIVYITQGIGDAVDVVMEGGTFLDEDIWAYYVDNDVPTARTLYEMRGKMSPGRVNTLLSNPLEPMDSLREIVDSDVFDDREQRSLDAIRRMYSALHMRSNAVQRTQVGTRVVSDGPFLDHVLNLPSTQRMQTFPFTDGKIPHGVPPIKLAVTRSFAADVADIRYERTNVAPTRPYWMHVLGFVAKEGRRRLLSNGSDGDQHWVRKNPIVRTFVENLLYDARSRSFFDEDALATLQSRVFDHGEQKLIPLGAVAGLELWLQRHVDPLY
ncbi:MAG: hypothetical protein ACQETI_11210, partial [Halobacteriota archaeon]